MRMVASARRIPVVEAGAPRRAGPGSAGFARPLHRLVRLPDLDPAAGREDRAAAGHPIAAAMSPASTIVMLASG